MSTPENLVSEELTNLIADLEKRVDEIAGCHMNVALVIFPTEHGRRMSYASNCSRDYVADAFASLLSGWRQGMPDIPAHEYNG